MAEPDNSRFLPGEIFAGRYRLVSLLGRGGMGEVYRADDLRLGQAVALKLLPPEFAHDAEWHERFVNEARMALRVTHSNVCRVFDIGEADGQFYLTMEYVDGEDLASLLRRIGRLHKARAAEIGRQICAGLAAAHAEGVLHRDLKPSNLMLDGRGRVKITDFGLAVRRSAEGNEARVGTPGYMAPEQLAGGIVSVQTDLYGLGLVLYEIFTGKRRLEVASEIRDRSLEHAARPLAPSHHIQDLDPVADRIILSCLEPDPADRPKSALAVGAALTGGKPVETALNEGETPLPEEVGEMGAREAMKPSRALAMAVGSVLLLALAWTVAGRYSVRAKTPMHKQPAVLVDKARDVIRLLGYTDSVYSDPADTAFGYSTSPAALDWIDLNNSSANRWDQLGDSRHGVVSFWYRQGPHSFVPTPGRASLSPPVDRSNPLPNQPGEILVGLDLEGRLERFAAITRPFGEPLGGTSEQDWPLLFELAGLSPSEFSAVEPLYRSFAAPDRRAAWVGLAATAPRYALWIEAGSYRGRTVQFAVLRPWELALMAGEVRTRYGVGKIVSIMILLAILGGAALLARRNLRAGRADVRGASRLSLGILALVFLNGMLDAHTGFYESPIVVFRALGWAVFVAAGATGGYLAFEPRLRRDRPDVLASWSRLLSGVRIRWWDPAVGRSILAGAMIGGLAGSLRTLAYPLIGLVAGEPPRPALWSWDALRGLRATLANLVWVAADSVWGAAALVVLFVGALLLVRRKLPATVLAVGVVIFLVAVPLSRVDFVGGSPAADVIALTLTAITTIVLLMRFDMVALVVAAMFWRLELLFPTPDWTAWHAQPSIVALVAVTVLVAYGYRAATTGGGSKPGG